MLYVRGSTWLFGMYESRVKVAEFKAVAEFQRLLCHDHVKKSLKLEKRERQACMVLSETRNFEWEIFIREISTVQMLLLYDISIHAFDALMFDMWIIISLQPL